MNPVPLTDPEMAQLLLRWGKSFVASSAKRLTELEERMDELSRRSAIAQAIEDHDKQLHNEDTAGAFGPPSARQQYDISRAELETERVELSTKHANNQAMVAFIERLLEDMPKRQALSQDESELLQWKAQKASESHARDLILAEADTWPHVEAVWRVGWIKGYLARRGENRDG